MNSLAVHAALKSAGHADCPVNNHECIEKSPNKIPDWRTVIMLHITDKAKEQIKEMLENNTDDSTKKIRLIESQHKTNVLEFVLDTPQNNDQIIKSKEGKDILLIGEHMSNQLNDFVIDYQTEPDNEGFVIEKATS